MAASPARALPAEPVEGERMPDLEFLTRRVALFQNESRRLAAVIQQAVADLETGAPREAVVLDLAASLECF